MTATDKTAVRVATAAAYAEEAGLDLGTAALSRAVATAVEGTAAHRMPIEVVVSAAAVLLPGAVDTDAWGPALVSTLNLLLAADTGAPFGLLSMRVKAAPGRLAATPGARGAEAARGRQRS